MDERETFCQNSRWLETPQVWNSQNVTTQKIIFYNIQRFIQILVVCALKARACAPKLGSVPPRRVSTLFSIVTRAQQGMIVPEWTMAKPVHRLLVLLLFLLFPHLQICTAAHMHTSCKLSTWIVLSWSMSFRHLTHTTHWRHNSIHTRQMMKTLQQSEQWTVRFPNLYSWSSKLGDRPFVRPSVRLSFHPYHISEYVCMSELKIWNPHSHRAWVQRSKSRLLTQETSGALN